MPAKRSVKNKPASPSALKEPMVHRSMNVMEIIALHPGNADIMATWGLHCFQCAFNTMDSLESGAKAHGLTDEDIAAMVQDINDHLLSRPPRPATITVTKAAAENILLIAEKEGKTGQTLTVTTDEHGSFCMEFSLATPGESTVFSHPDVPSVQISVSPPTLQRIGGAVIDIREGRFKLDLDAPHCGCGKSTCSCGRIDPPSPPSYGGQAI